MTPKKRSPEDIFKGLKELKQKNRQLSAPSSSKPKPQPISSVPPVPPKRVIGKAKPAKPDTYIEKVRSIFCLLYKYNPVRRWEDHTR
jgi:hypothetical protein